MMEWTVEELGAWATSSKVERYPPSHRELLSMIIQLMRKQEELEKALLELLDA